MIADMLFYGVCAFFLTLCISRYYRMPLGICFALASLITPIVLGISFLLLYRKSCKKFLTKKQLKDRDALLFHLALEKQERVRAALLEAFLADGKDAHCEGDELCVDGRPVVALFSLEPIGADEIAKLIRKFEKREFTVVCKSLTAEAEKLLSSFSLKALREDEVFDLFTRTNKTPNPLICGEVPRKTFRKTMVRAFSKKNAHPFFLSGILLLIMSLFVMFPVYYLTAGAVLLALSIGVRLLGTA